MKSKVRGRYDERSSENSSTPYGLLFPSLLLKGIQVQGMGRQNVSRRGRPLFHDHPDS